MNNLQILKQLEKERISIVKDFDDRANGLTVTVYLNQAPSWFLNELEFDSNWFSKIENRMQFKLHRGYLEAGYVFAPYIPMQITPVCNIFYKTKSLGPTMIGYDFYIGGKK